MITVQLNIIISTLISIYPQQTHHHASSCVGLESKLWMEVQFYHASDRLARFPNGGDLSITMIMIDSIIIIMIMTVTMSWSPSSWSWPSPCPGMCTGSETLHPSSGLALISWSSWPGDRYYHHRRHQSEWSLNVDPGDRDYFDNGDSDNIEGRERSWESSLRLSKERSSKQLIPSSGSYRQSYHEFKYKVPSNQNFFPPKKNVAHTRVSGSDYRLTVDGYSGNAGDTLR